MRQMQGTNEEVQKILPFSSPRTAASALQQESSLWHLRRSSCACGSASGKPRLTLTAVFGDKG